MHDRLLSPAQKAAVTCVSSPAIVTAGAGSGKTRTLTSKIAYLVNELDYDTERILAITFTNKAADEMKGRLQEATGRSADDFPWVRTFHSACFRILKAHCDPLGYHPPLLIHADSQQKAHLKKVLAELNLDRKYLYAAAGMISNAKNSGDPYKYLNSYGRLPRRLEVYRRYNEMLEQNNSVDFDDILLLARDLLKKFPDIRRHYQQVFDYILIDEFQDSNAIQNEIIDLLVRNGNLTVVGDDYQSIYRFRGADPFHFINFPDKYEGCKVFRLEQNYRSTAQIVAAADALIFNNSMRIEKECFSTRNGSPVGIKRLPDEEAEAAWVADRCWEVINYRKISPDRVAVLYRTKFTSLPFERALRTAGVPYTMVGAQGFFERREVQDINAYLVSAVNIKDDVSFERIINVPKRGIGAGAINKIFAAKRRDMSLQEAGREIIHGKALPKRTIAVLKDLFSFLDSLKHEAPAQAIQRVVGELSYEGYLKGYSDNEDDFISRMENIQQMIHAASQKHSIADYLEDAALIRDDQDDPEVGDRAIRLSTIHAAKGLEFEEVFVVALEERILPHYRSIGLEGEEENDEAIEEERRLMYVAMTRASDHLHLTCSKTRRKEIARPSRFIEEIPKHLLQDE